LCDLHAKGASFVFATHFHEILKMDEMQELTKPGANAGTNSGAKLRGTISIKHMAVHYDRELDCLVYDRKLTDGPGNRMYGLEVCKSLHLPSSFLEHAYQIRAKYFPETKGELSHPVASQYNARKIRGLCEMCHIEIGEETHHLQEQRRANADGFIDGFHKNHAANLMSLCSKCHDLVHMVEQTVEPVHTSPKQDSRIIPEKSVEKPAKKMVRKKTTKGYSVFVEPG